MTAQEKADYQLRWAIDIAEIEMKRLNCNEHLGALLAVRRFKVDQMELVFALQLRMIESGSNQREQSISKSMFN
jgi:hypothetical protein